MQKYISERTDVTSDESIVFDSKLVLPFDLDDLESSYIEDAKSKVQEYRKIKRSRSWSADCRKNAVSESRLIRERLLRTQARLEPRAVRWFTARQRLTLGLLALVDFTSFCSMSIMAPFFPKEAAEKGLSDTTSGMVFSFYAFVMFLTSPIFGKMLPDIGAKFMFTAGLFLTGSCNILFGTLELMHDTRIFTIYCFVIRGVSALGASAFSTASYVFVIKAFPNNISSVLGILETFVGLGMSVGPAVGGLLYSVGGFGLPFYVLGVIMLMIVPLNFCLLVENDDYVVTPNASSIVKLFKIPSILITGLVIVVVSNTWAFLDPTLEPHLRQFNLGTEQIGLIFLLFSGLYGIFSPIWGWVADRIHNHWCMMVWGLLLCTVGLLLLGPCPFIPGLPKKLWLDLVALSILGVSVALTLLPTFQGVLSSSIEEGGCPSAVTTYSVVAGIWACCYSLGEVVGPALGGVLTSIYGFPLCATFCAAACFVMALTALVFFSLRESSKLDCSSDRSVSSVPLSVATWHSNLARTPTSTSDLKNCDENSPLLSPESFLQRYDETAYVTPTRNPKIRDRAASFKEAIAHVLMFRFLTKAIHRARHTSEGERCPWEYERLPNLEGNEQEGTLNVTDSDRNGLNKNKRNAKTELHISRLTRQAEKFRFSRYYEIVNYNIEKVKFYERTLKEERQDIWNARPDLTNAKGTVFITATGACEV